MRKLKASGCFLASLVLVLLPGATIWFLIHLLTIGAILPLYLLFIPAVALISAALFFCGFFIFAGVRYLTCNV